MENWMNNFVDILIFLWNGLMFEYYFFIVLCKKKKLVYFIFYLLKVWKKILNSLLCIGGFLNVNI